MTEPSTGYRLSPPQEQAWETSGATGPGRSLLIARVHADLIAEQVAEALARLTARHDVLRTSFARPPGARRPLQVIAPPGAPAADPSGALRVELTKPDGDGTQLRLSASSLQADCETLRLLLRELVEASLPGAAPAPADMQFPYLNISEWHHDLLSQEESAEPLEWWRRRLDAVTVALDGGDSLPAPSAETERLPFECPPALGAAVSDTSRVHGVADEAVLMAAWILSQSFFSRSHEIALACRLDGRFSPELEGAVGPLSRFLPLVVRFSGDDTLLELAARVHAAREETAERQEYFHPPASGHADPLLSGRLTAFACLTAEAHLDLGAARVTVEREDVALPACCPFALQCALDARGLRGVLQYDRRLSRAEGEARLDAWLACLEWGVAHPRRSLRGVSPVSAEARRRLVAFAPASVLGDDTRLVPELIDAMVRERAQRPAALFGSRQLTYAELGARAEHVAAALAAAGVGLECPVGVVMRGCPAALVALLAVLRAGGVYVPLAPDDPPARLQTLVERLGIRTLLTTPEQQTRLERHAPSVIAVDIDPPLEATPARRPPSLAPGNGAYVIHTSGSTGEARGALVSHGALLASTRARRRYYGEPVERFLLVSPLVFDSSIAGLFWTLVDGGALVFPQASPVDPEELRALIVAHGVTHVLCIPRLLQALTEGGAAGTLASLRCAIVAGEACPREVAAGFTAAAPDCGLYNEYGVSEAGVWSTVHRVRADDAAPIVPIGAAIEGVRLYVCGDELQLLSYGAVGELCLAGAALARGYAGLPAATAARFMPDPHADVPGARLYRTGDLVRFSGPGSLDFVGRADHQVKIRGQRLELQQVEALVRAALPVAEVVAVVTGPSASPGLAVFYRPRPTCTVSPDDVRTLLEASLPAGLAPAHVLARETLPRTATGKVDRLALASTVLADQGDRRSEPAHTDVERNLAEIWAQALGLSHVGRRDDFFKLGGDSIVALQISARARGIGLVATPRQVLACRTIAALAAEITPVSAERSAPKALTRRLTPIQRWFFAEDFAEPHHYNQSLLLEAPRTIDLGALERALDAVVAAHPALRTGFERRGDEWLPVRAATAAARLHLFDVAQVDPVEQARLVERLLGQVQASFELARPPLLRAVVVERGAEHPPWVLLTAHHLVVDGVSWRVLLDDLTEAYVALSQGRAPALAPAPTSPEEWATALELRAGDARAQAALNFWLADAGAGDEETALPLDYPEGRNVEATAATVSLRLEPGRAHLLWQAGSDANPDAILLSALGRALGEWCGRDTTWVSLERHGRDLAEPGLDVSRTVGWLTAAFPLRLTCPRALSAAELASAVSAQLGRVPADVWLYGHLRQAPGDATSAALAALPRPRVSFNNLGRLRTSAATRLPLKLLDDPCGPLRSPRAHRPHVLDVTVTGVDHALHIAITYSTALHARSTIERLGEKLLVQLGELCAAAV